MSPTVPDEVAEKLSRPTPLVREAMEQTGGATVSVGAHPTVPIATVAPTGAERTRDYGNTWPKAGADFVMTGPGFGPGGVAVEGVASMRLIVGKCLGLQTAVGVHSLEESLLMIRARASRLGTGSGVQRMHPALAECEGNERREVRVLRCRERATTSVLSASWACCRSAGSRTSPSAAAG